MRKKLWVAAGVVAILSLSVSKGLLDGWAATRGNMVVFNANWCASCREVVPIVREVAAQNSISVTEIDVDSATAPKQAQGLGMGIPHDEPPQVFYVEKGRSTLIYNGKGYKFGYQDAAKTTILQNLQKALQ